MCACRSSRFCNIRFIYRRLSQSKKGKASATVVAVPAVMQTENGDGGGGGEGASSDDDDDDDLLAFCRLSDDDVAHE